MEVKFGLSEFEALEKEIPIRKGTAKTIKLILAVTKVPNTVLEEGNKLIALAQTRLKMYTGTLKDLENRIRIVSKDNKADDKEIKRLEKITQKFV